MAHEINISEYSSSNNYPLASPIKRLNRVPTDDTFAYETLAAAEAYASSSESTSVAYVGQLIYVQGVGLDSENKGLYYISDTAGTLSKIATGGDDIGLWMRDQNDVVGTSLMAKFQGINNSISGTDSTIFSSSNATIGADNSVIVGSCGNSNIYINSDNSSIISSNSGIINGSKYTSIIACNFGVVGNWATITGGHGSTPIPSEKDACCNVILSTGVSTKEESGFDGGFSISGSFCSAIGLSFKNLGGVYNNTATVAITGDSSMIASSTMTGVDATKIESDNSVILACSMKSGGTNSSSKNAVFIGCDNSETTDYTTRIDSTNCGSIISSKGCGGVYSSSNVSIIGSSEVSINSMENVVVLGCSGKNVSSSNASDNSTVVENLYGFGSVSGSSTFILSQSDAATLFSQIFND